MTGPDPLVNKGDQGLAGEVPIGPVGPPPTETDSRRVRRSAPRIKTIGFGLVMLTISVTWLALAGRGQRPDLTLVFLLWLLVNGLVVTAVGMRRSFLQGLGGGSTRPARG